MTIGLNLQDYLDTNLVDAVELLTDTEKGVLICSINEKMNLGVHEGTLPFVNIKTALIVIESIIAQNTEVEKIDVSTMGGLKEFVEGMRTLNHPNVNELLSINQKLRGHIIT